MFYIPPERYYLRGRDVGTIKKRRMNRVSHPPGGKGKNLLKLLPTFGRVKGGIGDGIVWFEL